MGFGPEHPAPGVMSLQKALEGGEEGGGLRTTRSSRSWSGGGVRGIFPAFPLILPRLAWATPGLQGGLLSDWSPAFLERSDKCN